VNLEYDIRKSILLSAYLKHWGMPDCRYDMTKDGETIELYSFPGDLIHKYATVGLSTCSISDSVPICSELFLALPSHIIDEQSEAIKNYIFDIASYFTQTIGKNVKTGDVVPESPLAPKGWPKALLFDEPRGEPEDLASFHIGIQHVNLVWVVPIFGNEYDLIKTKGIDHFDEAIQGLDLSVMDVRRKSCA
jgi:hypothetical protein